MSLQSISADWRPSLNGSADVAIRQNGLRQQNRPAGVTKSFCEEWVRFGSIAKTNPAFAPR